MSTPGGGVRASRTPEAGSECGLVSRGMLGFLTVERKGNKCRDVKQRKPGSVLHKASSSFVPCK